MKFEDALAFELGPARTAALVAWVQSLFEEDAAVPTLVGGAAVELYTLGAYTTGDLDFVGAVTLDVACALERAGFERHGRHWIQEDAQVFIEFPGDALGVKEKASWLEVLGHRIRIISAEDLLVERLGSWEYWRSAVDGVNALILWRTHRQRLDVGRVEDRVAADGWGKGWRSMLEFAKRWENVEPPAEEVEKWANSGP
jgi:hypothetical protein